MEKALFVRWLKDTCQPFAVFTWFSLPSKQMTLFGQKALNLSIEFAAQGLHFGHTKKKKPPAHTHRLPKLSSKIRLWSFYTLHQRCVWDINNGLHQNNQWREDRIIVFRIEKEKIGFMLLLVKGLRGKHNVIIVLDRNESHSRVVMLIELK